MIHAGFQNKFKHSIPLVVFFIGSVLLSGCSWLVAPPQDQHRARLLAERYSHTNGDLRHFKGLGDIHLHSREQSLSGRVVWAATMPDKLRIEILNAMGQPLVRLAGNGTDITIMTSNDTTVHRIRQKRNALEPIIHFPLGIEDLLALLIGRLPLPDYTAAQIVAADGNLTAVQLKNRWHTIVGEFHIDEQLQQIKQLAVFTEDGTTLYQIDWNRWQEYQNHRLPLSINLATGSGENLEFTFERYWLDVALPVTDYVLKYPEEKF